MASLTASQIARQAAMRRLESGSDTAAIAAATPRMLGDIEVAAGMAPGANVLKPNLFVESTDPNVDYLDALRTGLPDYVNAYRAYKAEEDAKNKKGDGTEIPGFNFDYDALAKLLQPWNYGYNQTSMIDFSNRIPLPAGGYAYPSPYGPTPDVRTTPAYQKALTNLRNRRYGTVTGKKMPG